MDAAGLSVLDFVDVGIECTLRQLLEHGCVCVFANCALPDFGTWMHKVPANGAWLSANLKPPCICAICWSMGVCVLANCVLISGGGLRTHDVTADGAWLSANLQPPPICAICCGLPLAPGAPVRVLIGCSLKETVACCSPATVSTAVCFRECAGRGCPVN